MWYNLSKQLLFRLEPETAHQFAMTSLKFVDNLVYTRPLISFARDLPSPFNFLELNFKNRLGLAAGFDKDGKYIGQIARLGFGHLEIGTVTPKPQLGNPKPRLFRLIKDCAIINRMGFNNDGVVAMRRRIETLEDCHGMILGGNIGKNKDTDNKDAYKDYLLCFDELYDCVDYFTINISSPNTPNLRELQEKDSLNKLLSELIENRNGRSKIKPILLKIAPDLTEYQLGDIVDIVSTIGIDGIVANNTTVSRENLKTDEQTICQIGNGGLSGFPLKNKSLEILNWLTSHSENLNIISVGGISSSQDAKQRWDNGASLVQIYSGLIYQGPSLIKNITKCDYDNSQSLIHQKGI